MSGQSSKYHLSISHLSQLLIHFFRKRSEFLRSIFQHRVINLKNGKFTLSGDHSSSGLQTQSQVALGGWGFVLDQGISGISEYQYIHIIHHQGMETPWKLSRFLYIPLNEAGWFTDRQT